MEILRERESYVMDDADSKRERERERETKRETEGDTERERERETDSERWRQVVVRGGEKHDNEKEEQHIPTVLTIAGRVGLFPEDLY